MFFRLLELTSQYKEVWSYSYLDSVGLSDSLSALRSLLRLLLPDGQPDALVPPPSPGAKSPASPTVV